LREHLNLEYVRIPATEERWELKPKEISNEKACPKKSPGR
jgi:hypothetical protein